MALYQVTNQWGGSSAPWNEGGMWAIAHRSDQNVVAIAIKSDDDGQTLKGAITYNGEEDRLVFGRSAPVVMITRSKTNGEGN